MTAVQLPTALKEVLGVMAITLRFYPELKNMITPFMRDIIFNSKEGGWQALNKVETWVTHPEEEINISDKLLYVLILFLYKCFNRNKKRGILIKKSKEGVLEVKYNRDSVELT